MPSQPTAPRRSKVCCWGLSPSSGLDVWKFLPSIPSWGHTPTLTPHCRLPGGWGRLATGNMVHGSPPMKWGAQAFLPTVGSARPWQRALEPHSWRKGSQTADPQQTPSFLLSPRQPHTLRPPALARPEPPHLDPVSLRTGAGQTGAPSAAGRWTVPQLQAPEPFLSVPHQ